MKSDESTEYSYRSCKKKLEEKKAKDKRSIENNEGAHPANEETLTQIFRHTILRGIIGAA